MAQNTLNSVTTTVPATYTLRNPALRVSVRCQAGSTDTLDVRVVKENQSSFPLHVTSVAAEVVTIPADASVEFEGEEGNRIAALILCASDYSGAGETVASFTVLK